MKHFNLRLFLILFLAGLIGAAAVLPYTVTLLQAGGVTFSAPLGTVLVIQYVETAILLLIALLIGMRLSTSVGLGLPYLEPFLAGKKPPKHFWRVAGWAALSGVILSIAIVLLDFGLFGTSIGESLARSATLPFWQRALATLYGGIDEEILMRFFLMTIFAWLAVRFLKKKRKKSVVIGMWTAIVLTAVLFAVGHLPFSSPVGSLSLQVFLRALLLNGLAGVVFGWFYWKKGLEHAMIAHFAADIMLFLLLPLYASMVLVG
ncbi:MAG: CPBP family intramembrane glutamic endopeptidase [Candidatus Peribacteraceae bacterium]|jgi:membrane protease YdiL (CAAX protease family)